MRIHPQNVNWFVRMASILLLVGATEALIVQFVHKPLPWVCLTTALLPLLTSAFVIFPILKQSRASTPKV